MNVKQMNNFQYDVALGRIDRTEKVWKFGEGEVTTSPTTVWKGSEQQPGVYIYPDQPYIMQAVSDDAGDITQTMIIQGLDKHWKPQEEFIQLNGTTPVNTLYEYLRINRLSILGGGSLLGNIEVTQTGTTSPIYSYISDGGFDRNQTQQAFVSVAAGYTMNVTSLENTSFESKKTNLYVLVKDWGLAESLGLTDPPFRVQINWNLFRNTTNTFSDVPIAVTEKIDVELRGYTETGADNVTSVLQGVMHQLKSVPIDLQNFLLTAGETSITVYWDEQTPAETGDMANFVVDIYRKDKLLNQYILTDKNSTGLTINDLITEEQYKIEAYWVGYDGRRSTIESHLITVDPLTLYEAGDGLLLDLIIEAGDGELLDLIVDANI